MLGFVAGHVFLDLNGNGVQDSEPNQASTRVFIYSGGVTRTVQTDANGNFSLPLRPGPATVTLDLTDPALPPTPAITTGNQGATLTISAQQLSTVTFGVWTPAGATATSTRTPSPTFTSVPPGSSPTPSPSASATFSMTPTPLSGSVGVVTGKVFLDSNGDGTQTSEPSLAGAMVTVYAGGLTLTAFTDSNGFFSLVAPSGPATVVLALNGPGMPANPVVTTTGGASLSGTIPPGGSLPLAWFGVMTLKPTPTPPSDLIVQLGPVPQKRGGPLCLYPTSPLDSSDWTLFGPDQQLVARLKFSGGEPPCFTGSSQLAPGYYLVKIRATDTYGREIRVTKHILIEP